MKTRRFPGVVLWRIVRLIRKPWTHGYRYGNKMADSRLQMRVWELEQHLEVTQDCYNKNLVELRNMAARLDRMKAALQARGKGPLNLPA